MAECPEISVIIPYGYSIPEMMSSLQSADSEDGRIEIIIVTNRKLRKELEGQLSHRSQVVESDVNGRGYFCSIGAKIAKGAILLFLHADTTLPDNWYRKLLNVMTDPEVAGGGFSVDFRSDHWYLRNMSKLYNWFSCLIKELWGDRALFIRKKILLENLERIEVPIMEDVEMSKIIRSKGKMVLLPEKVSTSILHFSVKGHLRHTVEVIIFRTLYSLGVQAKDIYKWYYKQFNI